MGLPTYFISHGPGPWPVMPHLQGAMARLEQSLQDIPRQLGVRPRAILVISAHWEEPDFSLTVATQLKPIYDFFGFPASAYQLSYPARGLPELANHVRDLLESADISAQLDTKRGLDHGAYVPLMVMYPDADLPVVQLSLKSNLDAAQHVALGRALAPLRDEGVLILASGMSYHNLRRLGHLAKVPSESFDRWLYESLNGFRGVERVARLVDWISAPAARDAHPREEHLIPLMVALGAAEEEPATCVYRERDILGGVAAASFRFGNAATPPEHLTKLSI
ncbi:dioxygenase [Trinickia terrae]|uniref:Dioxygenase n=1 Tax=Trinickia terrae TaxID=2571161 RepID=A0A4U1I9H9_9BURK|nr:class III extradiol ring-cleavage dioxygenase [Trinickia terrae]TKC90067.1 dioxygenase [Trinickia terrae]